MQIEEKNPTMDIRGNGLSSSNIFKDVDIDVFFVDVFGLTAYSDSEG